MLENQDVIRAPGNNQAPVRSQPTIPVAFMLQGQGLPLTHCPHIHRHELEHLLGDLIGAYLFGTNTMWKPPLGMCWGKPGSGPNPESVPPPPPRPGQIGHRQPSPHPPALSSHNALSPEQSQSIPKASELASAG